MHIVKLLLIVVATVHILGLGRSKVPLACTIVHDILLRRSGRSVLALNLVNCDFAIAQPGLRVSGARVISVDHQVVLVLVGS